MWIAIAIPCIIYCAGMILNDAFDARIDAHERAQRPIPRGHVRRAHAFVAGFAAAYGSSPFSVIVAILFETILMRTHLRTIMYH